MDWQQVKDVARDAAGIAGTALAAAFLVWRRHKKKLAALLGGEDEDRERIITRREWHRLRDRVNNHEFRLVNLTNDYTALREEVEEHLKESREAMLAFQRLDARFAAHEERWEEAGKRAVEDRRDLRDDVRRLSEHLDSVLRLLRGSNE